LIVRDWFLTPSSSLSSSAGVQSGTVVQSPAGHQLALALKSLNGRIREVQGFNLAVTRVRVPWLTICAAVVIDSRVAERLRDAACPLLQAKDKLVILSAKLEQFKRLKSGSHAPRPDIESFLQRDQKEEDSSARTSPPS
jgi:hypothetical protein